jgi:hypothetical protein
MKKMMTVVLMAIIPAGSLLAHHSLGNFDTTKAVRVKGTLHAGARVELRWLSIREPGVS